MLKFVQKALALVLLFALLCLVACKKTASTPTATTDIGTTNNPQIDSLTALLSKDPNNPAIFAARAELFYQNEAFDNALSDIAKALARDSTNRMYLHLLADIYLDGASSLTNTKESPSFKAIKTMEHAAALYPDSIGTLLKLSEFQMILQQNKESMMTLDKILRKNPTNDEAYFMMGMNFKEMGDTARAIRAFEKCVQNNSDHIDGYNELGLIYTLKNNPKAVLYFDNALAINPKDTKSLYNKAIFFQNRREDAKAKAIYRQIIGLDRDYADVYFNMSVIYIEEDSLKQALDNLDLTVIAAPRYTAAYYYRGMVYETLGKKEQALENYKQAVGQKPSYTEAKLALERLATKK